MKQLTHDETLKKMSQSDNDKGSLILVLCGLSGENLGLILRSADSFSVKKIYYIGVRPENEVKIKKISRFSNTSIEFVNDDSFLKKILSDGYSVFSLEITDTSEPISQESFPEKTCFIIGNENFGVPQELLDISQKSFHIEMTGSHISSLNAAVSASIAMYLYSIRNT